MFIKLTRSDGTPIWLNASFVVTVEPRKQGGSIVVPIGDGLDYDVRERPEEVLGLLAGAPAPAVVPVPTSDALTATPEDVSPEGGVTLDKNGEERPSESAGDEAKALGEKKPRARKAKTAASDGEAKPKKTRTPRKASRKAAEPTLTEEQVDRLRKLGPKSVGKLQNTLATQFKVENVEDEIAALVAKGVLTLDSNRVNWS